MLYLAFWMVLGHVVGAILLGWIYFRRYPITRPPIGVLNLWDVAIMVGVIVLMPYLYLALPRWLVVGLLASGVLSLLYFVWEPVVRARWAIWLITSTLIGADIGAMLAFRAMSTPFLVVNNVVLILAIVGVTNLWAQSGMRARDVAVLAAALAIYDVVATWQMPLMTDVLHRLADLPFTPLVAWHVGSTERWLGIGLGDLLLATVFPLVMRKAFGRAAGITALTISLGALGALLALPIMGIVGATFPVMIVLGPLMVLQYGYYRRQRGLERTTWQYLQAEPMRGRGAVQP